MRPTGGAPPPRPPASPFHRKPQVLSLPGDQGGTAMALPPVGEPLAPLLPSPPPQPRRMAATSNFCGAADWPRKTPTATGTATAIRHAAVSAAFFPIVKLGK